MSAGDPYVAGEFCCPSSGCLLIKTGASQWKKFPHVTEITYNEAAQQQGLVTSDTEGQEQAGCGAVNTTGSLAYACHDGFQPGMLCVNTNYQLRWSFGCENIWLNDAVVADPDEENYHEAIVKITTVPYNQNISQPSVPVQTYQWKLVSWVSRPSCQASVTD
jgi:hypothetical protein